MRSGWTRRGRAAITIAVLTLFATAAPLSAQTVLKLFAGAQQRSENLRQTIEAFSRDNPGLSVELVGGATPGEQQAFLAGALTAKAPAFDLVLLDMLRLPQWTAAQWLEPLDTYLGAERDGLLARYLPAYRSAGFAGGKLHALPFLGDAQFLYYRRDLLEKHGLEPPRTWDELKAAAARILAAENNPALQGFEAAGAPIESTVCSFLVPLWGTGEDFLAGGKPNLGGAAARKPFELFTELKEAKLTPVASAEIHTDRIRQQMQEGNLIFGLGWGYAWQRFQNDAASGARGRIGLLPPPGFSPEHRAGCLGGWQVAVSAFSRAKPEAARFARYLASPEAARFHALQGGLPVLTGLYQDAEILAAQPWFAEALPAMLMARPRPASPRYSEVSEIIRTNLSAFLAGTKTADAALADMNGRLALIFR